MSALSELLASLDSATEWQETVTELSALGVSAFSTRK